MANTATTDAKVNAALAVLAAIADAIRELGSVPSGHLYANLMGHMSLDTYNKAIDRLIGAGLVRLDTSHLLTWIGPAKDERTLYDEIQACPDCARTRCCERHEKLEQERLAAQRMKGGN